MARIELIFRPEAEADICRISDYTEVEWGRAQAKRYVMDINIAIKGLLEFPAKGTTVPLLGPNYRKISSGSHRILYRLDGANIVIVRILHERMDVENEVGPPDYH